jgi:hypothetical protein
LPFPFKNTLIINNITVIMPARRLSNNNMIESHPCRESITTRKSLTKSNERPRSVHFSQKVHVQKVLHVSDYTSSEHEASWYKSADYSAMKQEMNQAVKSLAAFGIFRCRQFVNPDFTIRGLEGRTVGGGKDRMQNKIVARRVVMQQQQLQKYQNVFDPEYLAKIYRNEARHCQLTAQEIGKDDEYVARIIYGK